MPIFKRTISDELIKATFYLSRSDKAKLKKAISFCESAHVGQFRKTGEPYSNHPINVALICAGWRLDVEALVAGLLHDTVEDTATSLHNISNLYGDKVAELVDGLSKVDQLVYRSFEEKTAENFRKMLLATAADARVILIKLADRLHNMQTLSALSKKQVLVCCLWNSTCISSNNRVITTLCSVEALYQVAQPHNCPIRLLRNS